MRFSGREKSLISVLAIISAVSIVYLYVSAPSPATTAPGMRSLDQSRQDLKLIEELYSEYGILSARKRKIENGLSRPESLVESIEKASVKNALTEQKSSLKEEPEKKRNNLSVRSVTVKFESASMPRIVQFLADMEGGNSLNRVTYFNARRAIKGKNVFDVTITYELYAR